MKIGNSIEDQLQSLVAIKHTITNDGQEKVKKLQSLYKEIQQAGVKGVDDARALELEWIKLESAVEKQEKVLGTEILNRQKGDVSTEQMQEFKDVFNHYDKDHSGNLSRQELKACLQALGDELKDDEMDAIWTNLDPNKTGKVDLPTFTKFMVDRNKDSDSPEMLNDAFRQIAANPDYITEDELKRSGLAPDRVSYLLSVMPKFQVADSPLVAYDYKKYVAATYNK